MEKGKITYADPHIIEEKRIKEVRSLSYLERLERLFVLIDVSQRLQKASKSKLNQDA